MISNQNSIENPAEKVLKQIHRICMKVQEKLFSTNPKAQESDAMAAMSKGMRKVKFLCLEYFDQKQYQNKEKKKKVKGSKDLKVKLSKDEIVKKNCSLDLVQEV
jgi:hypothetical protein